MGEGTTIHRLTPLQYELAAAWLARPEINRWLYAEWRGRVVDPKLVAVVAMNSRNALYVALVDGRPVGIVALGEINRIDSSASVWYLLGVDDLAGRGVISSAVGLLCQAAVEEFSLHTLHASVIDGNQRSIRVLEKNGFRYAGCLRQAFRLDDGFVDRFLFDRVNSESSTQ